MDDMGVGIDGKCRHRYRLHMATDKYLFIYIYILIYAIAWGSCGPGGANHAGLSRRVERKVTRCSFSRCCYEWSQEKYKKKCREPLFFLLLSWIPKASRASVYRSWRGGTYTYPKWPRMQNICKTHVKHRFLRWWNVCDAYVKRMCSASENICEPYVKYMWNICEIHVTY